MADSREKRLLWGKPLRDKILAEVKAKAEELRASGIHPTLAVFYAQGENAAERYCTALKLAADQVQVKLVPLPLNPELPEQVARSLVLEVASAPQIHGILVLEPSPWPGLSLLIPPEKDVDGAHPANLGRLLWQGAGSARFSELKRTLGHALPTTPQAVLELLLFYGFDLRGKEAVVVGGGRVGLPLSVLLLRESLSVVTVCERNARELGKVTRQADLICLTAGSPGILKAPMVRPGAVVVDVGTSVCAGKIVGDADPGVAEVAGAWTPVPGGVGPVTVAILLHHLVEAARRIHQGGCER
jgi:5,10-methylene-tetrahydrofolate dehydrogenase/Methenyl tetrahydrofolate cyclohydrolase